MFLFRVPPIAPDPAVGDVMSGGDITWLQLLKNKLEHLNLINGSGITAVQVMFKRKLHLEELIFHVQLKSILLN